MSGMERKRYLWMFVWLLLPEATSTSPINVTLPVGTAMDISGRQEVTTLTASALGRSVSGSRMTRCLSLQGHGTANIQVGLIDKV